MIDPVDVFRARADARALLWRAGEYTLHEAVDVLQADAQRQGLVAKIGQDAVQEILAAAFADPPPADLEPEARDSGVAHSTLDAAAWLWFQVGDEKRFNRFLEDRSSSERAVILNHIKDIEARNAKNGR